MTRRVWTRQPPAVDGIRGVDPRFSIGVWVPGPKGMRKFNGGQLADVVTLDARAGMWSARYNGSTYQDTDWSSTPSVFSWVVVFRCDAVPNSVDVGAVAWRDGSAINWNHVNAAYRGVVSFNSSGSYPKVNLLDTAADKWHTVVCVATGSEIRVYQNGRFCGSTAASGAISAGTWRFGGTTSATLACNIALAAVSPMAIADGLAISANPWALFAPRNDPTFFLGPAAGGVTIDAGVGAATAAGLSATIASGITVAAGVGAALGAGLAGGVASGITLLSGVGVAAAAGVGAAVASPITIAVGVGAATGTGLAAGVSSAVTVAAGIGAAAAGGLQAGVSVGAAISAGTGAANAAGLAAGVSSPITVAATVGAAVGAGKSASVSAGGTVEAGVGAAAAGSHPALVSSPQAITAGTGTATASGRQASIGSGTTIPAGIGAASALGLTATVTAATHIVAGIGSAVARGLKAGVSDATPAVLAQFGVRGASAIQRQARGRLAQVQRGRRIN